MAEKDLDPPKLKPFPSPSLLTAASKVPSSGESRSGEHHDGYYQNVSQKAKLILPTALWILIVVAGLCFLSLLSSLNKSIKTLDTLVELERADSDARASQLSNALEAASSSSNDQPSIKGKPKLASWFSFPSWTSLEPAHKQEMKSRVELPSEDMMFQSLIDEVLKDSNDSPVGGRIIIGSSSSSALPSASSSGENNSNDQQQFGNILNGFDSIVKQLMAGQGDEQPKPDRGFGDDRSMLTANIDTLNININAPGEVEQVDKIKSKKTKNKKMKTKKAAKRLEIGNENEHVSLGKEIEKMLSKIEGTQEDFMDHPDSVMIPIISPIHPGSQQHKLARLNPFSADDEIKPAELPSLSNLLMPASHLKLNEPSNRPLSNSNPLDAILSRIVDPISAPEMLVQVSQSEPLPNNQHPSGLPPFELFTSSRPNFEPTVQRQSLLPVQESLPTKKETNEPIIIESLDSFDQPQDSKKKSESNGTSKGEQNAINDLLGMFFGPRPNSSLVVAPQLVEQKINLAPASGEQIQPKLDSIDNSEKSSSIQEVSAGKENQFKQSTTAMPSTQAAAAAASVAQPELIPIRANKQENQSMVADSIVGDLFGSMISLPQSSGQRDPIRTNSQLDGPLVVTSDMSASSSTPNITHANPNVEKVIEIKEFVEPQKVDIDKSLELEPQVSMAKTTGAPVVTEAMGAQTSSHKMPDNAPVSLAPVQVSVENITKAKERDGAAAKSVVIGLDESSAPIATTKIPTTSPPSKSPVQLLKPTTQAPSMEIIKLPTVGSTTAEPEKPFKTFLKRADDFIERNLVNFKRLLSE